MPDYYEDRGQELSVQVAWLRSNGYQDALCVLPHDGKTTEAGREALGWYHEKIDEESSIGLGPDHDHDHDWASHCADAFGLMAVAYEAPVEFDMPEPDCDWVV